MCNGRWDSFSDCVAEFNIMSQGLLRKPPFWRYIRHPIMYHLVFWWSLVISVTTLFWLSFSCLRPEQQQNSFIILIAGIDEIFFGASLKKKKKKINQSNKIAMCIITMKYLLISDAVIYRAHVIDPMKSLVSWACHACSGKLLFEHQ